MDSLTMLLNASLAVRRLIAVGLLLLVVLAFGASGYIAAEALLSDMQQVTDKRIQLGRLHAVIAMKPQIEASMPAENASAGQPEFLHGESEPVIRAGLQTLLNKIAQDHGVNVLSVGNTPVIQQGDNRFAGLRANISGTNEGIIGAINAIDTSEPYLTIREASIQSTLESQIAGKKGPPELVMQIQFYGALPPEAVAGGKSGAVK